ncbi:MAG: hypothetical protein VX215_01550 [Pseudomonadota bacterium]|nr:hypothetical protein [Pseudomonadota bacterium]
MSESFNHLIAPGIANNTLTKIQGIFEDIQYDLVQIKIKGGKKKNIQILAEKQDFNMSIKDCGKLSNILKFYFDNNESEFEDYVLEVSSPGVERPLTREKDFETWSENRISVRTVGQNVLPVKFDAMLKGYSEKGVKIEVLNKNTKNFDTFYLNPNQIQEVKIRWINKEIPTFRKTQS